MHLHIYSHGGRGEERGGGGGYVYLETEAAPRDETPYLGVAASGAPHWPNYGTTVSPVGSGGGPMPGVPGIPMGGKNTLGVPGGGGIPIGGGIPMGGGPMGGGIMPGIPGRGWLALKTAAA